MTKDVQSFKSPLINPMITYKIRIGELESSKTFLAGAAGEKPNIRLIVNENI